jgi:glutathione S-transferase
MKLYFSPGACSLSPHIALREAGLPFDAELVNIHGDHKTQTGADYYAINPKGSVPALQLDNGQVLTEGAAIVQYIADQKPEAKLAPLAGTFERYRLAEWLNYLAAELHKAFGPLFNKANSDEVKEAARGNVGTKLDFIEKSLGKKDYLLGDQFTVADGYLFTLLSWTKGVKIDLAKWPMLAAFVERVGARPAVKAAVEAEQRARPKN